LRSLVTDRGQRPITEAAIDAAKRFFVVATNIGGIQIETHQSGIDLEIEIGPDGTIQSVLMCPAMVIR